MIKSIVSFLLLSAIQSNLFSQHIKYYDGKGSETNLEHAMIIETTNKFATDNYLVVKQKTNKDTISSIQYSSLNPLVRNGLTKLYNKKGSLDYSKHYIFNKLDGRLIRYYENGKIMSVVDMVQDSVISARSYNSKGKEIAYVDDLSKPVFMNKPIEYFRQYLAQNIHYPDSAAEAREKGRFRIEFKISESGSIYEIKLIGGDFVPALANEVIRVIKSTDGKWAPANKFGESITYKYSFFTNFEL